MAKFDNATDTQTNAAATASIGGSQNFIIAADQVIWSYSADPTGGRLQIKDGSTVLVDFDITKGGPGFMPLSGIVSTRNSALSAVLAAGGAGIVGKVNLVGRI